MKRIISLALALVLLASCVAVLASCGAPKDSGAEISVYLGEEIYDFDPTDYYVDSNAEQVMSLLFEPLFTVNEKGKLKKEGAAKDYDVDKDERTITIELRETYWSDEIRVTANDFLYAWRDILLEPTNANPAAALLYDIENAVAVKSGEKSLYELGVDVTDTYELTITYREGADYEQLLKNLACVATSPVRQDMATSSNAGYWTKIINTAVTNGAFKIDNIDYESGTFTVSRNIGYHQNPTEKRYTDEVIPNKLISFTNNEGNTVPVSYNDLVNKTVFYMADAPLADRSANKGSASVADDLSTYTYVFNTEKELFADAKVRRALSLAIDRNAIISAITFGKAATGFLPDSVLIPGTKDSFRNQNLIAAEAKMDEALTLLGEVDLTGISKDITLSVNDDPESLAIADIVKAAWEELGFTVEIDAVGSVSSKVVDFTTNEQITINDSGIQRMVKEASRGERDFDVIAVDWQMYSTDPFVALCAFAESFSGCGALMDNGSKELLGSFGGYCDEDYNDLIRAAYLTTGSSRIDILRIAEKVLVDSACIVPLVYNQSFAFIHEDISDVEFDGLGNFVLKMAEQKDYEDYLD